MVSVFGLQPMSSSSNIYQNNANPVSSSGSSRSFWIVKPLTVVGRSSITWSLEGKGLPRFVLPYVFSVYRKANSPTRNTSNRKAWLSCDPVTSFFVDFRAQRIQYSAAGSLSTFSRASHLETKVPSTFVANSTPKMLPPSTRLRKSQARLRSKIQP